MPSDACGDLHKAEFHCDSFTYGQCEGGGFHSRLVAFFLRQTPRPSGGLPSDPSGSGFATPANVFDAPLLLGFRGPTFAMPNFDYQIMITVVCHEAEPLLPKANQVDGPFRYPGCIAMGSFCFAVLTTETRLERFGAGSPAPLLQLWAPRLLERL